MICESIDIIGRNLFDFKVFEICAQLTGDESMGPGRFF